jgi:hypothetical protein
MMGSDGVTKSEEDVHIMHSDQKETETRMVLYVNENQGYDPPRLWNSRVFTRWFPLELSLLVWT